MRLSNTRHVAAASARCARAESSKARRRQSSARRSRRAGGQGRSRRCRPPPRAGRRRAGSAPVSSVVVVLPFVPVMPISAVRQEACWRTRPRSRRHAAASAACTTGLSLGTPGLLTSRSRSAGSTRGAAEHIDAAARSSASRPRRPVRASAHAPSARLRRGRHSRVVAGPRRGSTPLGEQRARSAAAPPCPGPARRATQT